MYSINTPKHLLQKLLIIGFSVALLLISGGLAPCPLQAEGQPVQESITVWPTFQEVTIQAGSQKDLSIFFKNEQSVTAVVRAYSRNIYIGSNPLEGTRIRDADDEPPASWITVADAETQLIESGETVEISFSISVPEDAEIKGYYPMIIVTAAFDQEGDHIASTGEIASIVYLSVSSVKGAVSPISATISGFEPAGSFSFIPKMDFEVAVYNEGDVHFQPRGRITVFDPNGTRQENSATYNDKFLFLLPGQQLQETLSWRDSSYSRIFPPIGEYTATFTLSSHDETFEPQEMTKSFYVFPLQYIGFGVIVIDVVIGIVILSVRKIRKQRKDSF